MTSQQDTELRDTQDLELEIILYAMAEDLRRGFVHSSVITTKQALTSWKDKEVRLARKEFASILKIAMRGEGEAGNAGEMMSVNYAQDLVNECLESLQSQGGK